jgi:hypothetical protein
VCVCVCLDGMVILGGSEKKNLLNEIEELIRAFIPR